MKVLFYGDSITDAGRNFNVLYGEESYGCGYVKYAAKGLLQAGYAETDIINKGISGNRIVDLYARIKVDCWNHEPDLLSILIGVNDVWHEYDKKNGVEIDRFDRMYRILLDDTKKRLPDLKIILCEPFVLKGSATDSEEGQWAHFLQVKEYAKVVKKIAEDYHLPLVLLQDKFDEAAAKDGGEYYLCDGVHPTAEGAKLIANEWLQVFKTIK